MKILRTVGYAILGMLFVGCLAGLAGACLGFLIYGTMEALETFGIITYVSSDTFNKLFAYCGGGGLLLGQLAGLGLGGIKGWTDS